MWLCDVVIEYGICRCNVESQLNSLLALVLLSLSRALGKEKRCKHMAVLSKSTKENGMVEARAACACIVGMLLVLYRLIGPFARIRRQDLASTQGTGVPLSPGQENLGCGLRRTQLKVERQY